MPDKFVSLESLNLTKRRQWPTVSRLTEDLFDAFQREKFAFHGGADILSVFDSVKRNGLRYLRRFIY